MSDKVKGHSTMNRILNTACWPVVLSFAVLVCGCISDPDTYDIPPPPRDLADQDFEASPHRPPSAKTLYALARILASQGRHQESHFVLARVMKEHPDFVPVYNELAELYLRSGKVEDAMKVLAIGLEKAPNDPVLLNNVGMCWMLKEDHEKALENFKAAAKQAPHVPTYRANIAVALGMMGRYDDALSEFKQVVTKADSHYNLAVICEAREDFERAAEEFKIAEELQPPTHGARS